MSDEVLFGFIILSILAFLLMVVKYSIISLKGSGQLFVYRGADGSMGFRHGQMYMLRFETRRDGYVWAIPVDDDKAYPTPYTISGFMRVWEKA